MTRQFIKHMAVAFFKERGGQLSNTRTLNLKQRIALFSAALDACGLPHPISKLKPFFAHPNLLSELLRLVYNQLPEDVIYSREISPAYDKLQKTIGRRVRSETSISIRVLDKHGLYPNIPISSADAKYVIHNHYPILICKHRNYKNWRDESIVKWLSRNELRFITSITCASDSTLFHFALNSNNSLAIDFDCVRGIPVELRTNFLFELYGLYSQLTKVSKNPYDRLPLSDIAEYDYSQYESHVQHFKALYRAFPIGNDLLLRTCNYHAKAMILWHNPILAEEAIVSNFHCIEGCLHLMQQLYGNNSGRLDLDLIRNLFISEIARGEDLFEYIREGYDKRISLVHANPKWGPEWSPYLGMSDFYDYYKLSKQLLNFILIKRHIDIS